MSIRKDEKSGVWFLDFRTPSGERVRSSTRTTNRKEAQEYHDRLKSQYWRQVQLGEKPNRLFEEGAVEFLKRHLSDKDYTAKARHIAYWQGKFAGRPLRSLTAAEIHTALPTQSAHRYRKGEVKPATKNRYLATIRTMLNVCVDLEWLDSTPKLKPYKEPKVRIRWEPQGVITQLIRSLRLTWMRDAAIVSVATGVRESELFTMTASQVALMQQNGHLINTKSGKPRAVPFNDDAIEILTRRMKGKTGNDLVFTRGGDEKSLHDVAIVAIATGMGEAQALALTPAQVDLRQRTVRVTDAETGVSRTFDLNDDALAVLRRRIKRKAAHSALFPRGKSMNALIEQHDKRDFLHACRAVGIQDFHWHDLRHTWASWHAQQGTPLMTLKELGGWETIEMVQKYAHLAPSHAAPYANAVKFWSSSTDKEKAPAALETVEA